MQEIIKHNLYIGFNDKDTKKQEVTDSNIIAIIEIILDKTYPDGYTYFIGNGRYNGINEKSIKVEILFADEIKTLQAIKEIKIALNQECIALQKEIIESDLI